MRGSNQDGSLKARGPLAPNSNPEETEQEKEQAAEAQHPVVAHSPARQGWASAATAILTFTHPPDSDTQESRCPSFALYYLAKGLKSLVTSGHIKVQNLELRSWVPGTELG